MNTVSVKRGYDIKIEGAPSQEIKCLDQSELSSVMPSDIPYIKPKLDVKIGDDVQIGSPLFHDKQDPRIVFLSPLSGTVKDVIYGERRRILNVLIQNDGNTRHRSFSSYDMKGLQSLSRQDLVNQLLDMGLWSALKGFPFRAIADPDLIPPSIYVSLDDQEPFKPSSEIYLKDKLDAFHFGLAGLKKLSDLVHVSALRSNTFAHSQLQNEITLEIIGKYPAEEAGVVLYHNKKSAEENKSWTISAQDVIRMGEGLLTGQYPTERVIVVAGSLAETRQHYRVHIGDAFADIIEGVIKSDRQPYVIAGGVFTGRRSTLEGYLNIYDDAIQIIEENYPSEFLQFFKLGVNKESRTRAFLSAFLPQKTRQLTASLNGSHRDCISCGICPQVCPVDLLPQYIFKQLAGQDIESAMSLGLLDCTQCGLCTYVCPSKIELDTAFLDAKKLIVKELSHE